MLSAASTARRRVSPVGVLSAAARIFSSTYTASRATYWSSSVLRMGYRWPAISTGMTRPSIMVVGHWSLVVGRWSLVIGRWSLVIGHWSLVVGHWSLVVGH